MYIWSIAGYFIAISFSNEIFIPVFYKLGINTTYEYLELRFGRRVRSATSIMFMCASIISTGVLIYAPATAISAVTGMLQINWGHVNTVTPPEIQNLKSTVGAKLNFL